MLARKCIVSALFLNLVFVVGPVNILALSSDPSGPIITELYSGANTFGSLDITEVMGQTRDDVMTTFTAADGSSILLNQNKLTGKSVSTLPGGRMIVVPQTATYQITLLNNSGQSWQVTAAVSDTSGGYLVGPNDLATMTQGLAAIEPASSNTLSALKSFLLAENLVTQNPDGSLAVRSELTISCAEAIVALAAAIYSGLEACAVILEGCPFGIFLYIIALDGYYKECCPDREPKHTLE